MYPQGDNHSTPAALNVVRAHSVVRNWAQGNSLCIGEAWLGLCRSFGIVFGRRRLTYRTHTVWSTRGRPSARVLLT